MIKLANQISLMRHKIEVGHPVKHAENHIPPVIKKIRSSSNLTRNIPEIYSAIQSLITHKCFLKLSPNEIRVRLRCQVNN